MRDGKIPSWNIHNKWAKKMRISQDVSNYVSTLVDFPQKCQEFSEHQRNIYRIEHDSGSKRKTVMYLQLSLLRKKGAEFVKAWFLHHALDYIERAPILTIGEVMERLERRTETCPELKAVKDLIESNSQDALRDCR